MESAEAEKFDPWIRDVIEGLAMAEQSLQSSLTSRQRLAWILVDNSMEIALRTFLKNSKNHAQEALRVDFPTLLVLAQLETPTSSISWTRIKYFHEIRNKLYHVYPEMVPKESDLQEYIRICRASCGEIFKLKSLPSLSSAALRSPTDDRIEWQIASPIELPNPLEVGGTKGYNFRIVFTVRAQAGPRIRIYVRSLSQAIIFFWPEPREIRKWRFGIIPSRETASLALDSSITQAVGLTETEFVFNAYYRPLHAISDYSRGRNVRVEYYLTSPDRTFESIGPRQIVIPFSKPNPAKPRS